MYCPGVYIVSERKAFKTVLLPFLITVILASCVKKETVYIDFPGNLKNEWISLIERNPYPDNFKITYDKEKDSICTIHFYTSDWQKPLNQGKTDLYITVKKDFYAPTVPLWNSRFDCSIYEVSQFPVRLINTINLPERALKVEGKYPDNDNYPLVRETSVSIEYKDDKIRNKILENWLLNLPKEIEEPEIAIIGSVGDIMPQRGVDTILLRSDVGYKQVFSDTLPKLQAFDLLLGNLEGTLTKRDVRITKSYNFRFNPDVLKPLKTAGFDYLSIANNHSYDYGEKGFIDTLNNLKKHGMPTSGAGETPEQTAIPWKVKIKDNQIQILSLGAFPQEKNGFNGFKQASVTKNRAGILWQGNFAFSAVKRSFNQDSFNIIMIHGGDEWHSIPNHDQIFLYRKLIDLGADLILGSHPHVLQGVEIYNKKLIAYSLGNFIFPGMEDTNYGTTSIILSVGIYKGKIIYTEFIPVNIDGKIVKIDKTGKILPRFLDLTKTLNK